MIIDTCFLLDLMHGDRAALRRAQAIESEGGWPRIPAPVLFELWEGAEAGERPAARRERLAILLEGFPTLDLTPRHAARAGALVGQLARRGVALGDVDALIAGTALEEGEPVLTRDLRDFQAVPGLRVETY